jgi:tRNA-dihydrouridine synthase B
VRAVRAPVTLKTRIGWDHEHKNGLRIARIATESGIQCLAIHGRTRADMYQGAVDYAAIAAIKASVNIPVIANGDIDSAEKARFVLENTACDAVMIGRAAQGKPWVFDEVNFFLREGQHRAPLASRAVHDIMRAHLEDLYAFYGDATGVRVARKHLIWYCQQHPGQKFLRDRLVRVATPQEQLSLLQCHFESQHEHAA